MNLPVKSLAPVPLWLAIGVILGFFVALLCVFLFGVPANGGEVLMIMVGTLTSLTTQIVSYYFGSSAGSKSKEDALLARQSPIETGGLATDGSGNG